MNAQEEIPKINNKLEQARRDFNETLMQVNEKVEETEKRLSPEEIIKRRPLMASCCAAATGFALEVRRGLRPQLLSSVHCLYWCLSLHPMASIGLEMDSGRDELTQHEPADSPN